MQSTHAVTATRGFFSRIKCQELTPESANPTAAGALGGTPVQGQKFSGMHASGAADAELRPLNVIPGTEASGPGVSDYLNYLFDGVTAGSGAVVVSWLYKGNVVVQNSVNLQLQTVSQMYEHATVINPAWIVNDTANGLGDLRTLPAGTIPSVAQITYNPYTGSSPQDNTMVVLVHGWRMKLSEMQDYGDTMFKRLYWQGYNGRFLAFTWPTGWTDTDRTGWTHLINDGEFLADPESVQNYDRSEQKAWNSAPALYNLLVSLDGLYGYQNVNILAHSMGNVVTSEALRIAATQAKPVPVVNAYIATQAAVPAEAYDPSTAPGSNDVYANFMGSGQAYFANLRLAAPNMYDFYNPDDLAVGTGFFGRWNLNNRLKPDGSDDYQSNWNNSAFFRFGRPINLSDPALQYEAFAFAAKSASYALGGTANVGGPFATANEVNLNTLFGFASDHSGEFDGTEQWRGQYWLQVMKDFGLKYWPQ